MTAETQAERTRAVIAQTLAEHEFVPTLEQDGTPNYGWCGGGDSYGTKHIRDHQAHQADEVARALDTQQAQTTPALTDDGPVVFGSMSGAAAVAAGRAAHEWPVETDAGLDYSQCSCGARPPYSPGGADDARWLADHCDQRIADFVLSARSAGERDAHQALTRVRAVLAQMEESESLWKHDLRRALGDADDRHDGSGT